MKTHIEYDDFGEFIEVLDDAETDCFLAGMPGGTEAAGASRTLTEDGMGLLVRRMVRGCFLTLLALTVVFSTTSFAACAEDGIAVMDECMLPETDS